MRRILMGLVVMFLGAAAGVYLPMAMIPRPREFDGLAILGWWMLLVPLGAILGLMLGLSLGKPPHPSEPRQEQGVSQPHRAQF
jgi:hypothetical protein